MRKESIPLTSIRGFAALWVAFYHYTLELKVLGYTIWAHFSWWFYGYVGVDIFFILSGFILTAVYRALDWRNLGAFLTRRVFRIYPMHVAVLLGMLILWLDIYYRFDVIDPTQQLSWWPVCALLLQPFFSHKLMWNAVTWSLSVEFTCYFLFPLAIMLFRRAPLALLLPLILLLGLVEEQVQIYDLYTWSGGAVGRGVVAFGLGMMLRLASERMPTPSALLVTLGECLAVGGIILCACFPEPPGHGGGPYVALFAALLILCLSYESGIVAKALSARACLWLGKISFSLYLLHEPVFGFAWARFSAHKLPFGHHTDAVVWVICTMAVTLGAATITWLLIEEPFRRLGGRIARWMERNNPLRAPMPDGPPVLAAPLAPAGRAAGAAIRA